MYRCHFSQVFVDEADYGYGAFNGERYNVFKEFTATRTIIDERESLWDLLGGIHGMVIADMGLIGADDQMNCVDVQISSYKRRYDLTWKKIEAQHFLNGMSLGDASLKR